MGGGGVKQVAQRFNIEHLVPFLINVVKQQAGDYLILDEKGVLPLWGFTFSGSPEGGAINHEEEFNYGYAMVDGIGTTKDTVTMKINGCPYERKTPYFIITGGNEIIEVVSETTPTAATSTLTLRRGCLGSTPTATGLLDEEYVTILNVVALASEYTGYELAFMIALPTDGAERCFK